MARIQTQPGTHEEEWQASHLVDPPFMRDETPTHPIAPIVKPEKPRYAREIFRYILVICFFVLPLDAIAALISYFALNDWTMVNTCVTLGEYYVVLWLLCVAFWMLCSIR